jgi:hypothetical protein
MIISDIRHPIEVWRDPGGAFVYQQLLRTYLRFGEWYWLDTPTSMSRIRLTHLDTGEYLIYGYLGEDAGPQDMGIDEMLPGYIFPTGAVRIKLAENRFGSAVLGPEIVYLGVSNNWKIRVIYDQDDNLIYQKDSMLDREKTQIRLVQYEIIRKAWYNYRPIQDMKMALLKR